MSWFVWGELFRRLFGGRRVRRRVTLGQAGLPLEERTVPATVAMLANINPTATTGSYPTQPGLFQGKVYFAADDGTHGRELWEVDQPTV
jgi:hypothetical protein